MIRVALPFHLKTLAGIDSEVMLSIEGEVTRTSILDALEARYPLLRGTIRDHATLRQRPLVRYFACQEDITHDPPTVPLPDAMASGAEPLLIVGAIAGGWTAADGSSAVSRTRAASDRPTRCTPSPEPVNRLHRFFPAGSYFINSLYIGQLLD